MICPRQRSSQVVSAWRLSAAYTATPCSPATARSHRSSCRGRAGSTRSGPWWPGKPVDHRRHVEAGDDLLGLGLDPVVAPPVQTGHLGAQLLIELAAMFHAQTGRFAHDQGGPPFRERPARQRRPRVRHLMDQRGGQPQVLVAAYRGLAARQRTSEANPFPRRAAGTRPPLAARRVAAHSAVARACAAAAADFSRSHRSTSARSAASPAASSISNKLSNMTPTLNHATDRSRGEPPKPE